MARRWMTMGMAALLALHGAAQAPMAEQARKSYAVGVDLARNLRRQGMPFDIEALLKGMRDGLTSAKPLLSDTDLHEALAAFQTDIKLRRARPMKMVADVNRTEGEAFLDRNKSREGVVTLPSGLQYKVLTEGEGRKPKPEDAVECHVRGVLLDGSEFENSYRRGQPATLRIQSAIPGMREALQGMSVGAKWQLFIPSNLAYGEKGLGSKIGPCSMLTFEIELLAIK